MSIKLNKINLSFKELKLYENFNLEIGDETTCIVGASGSGKTTLLNIISNLLPFSGEVINQPKEISYIFQSARLIPNLNVFDNIDYVLKSIIKDKQERTAVIDRYLKLVELYDSKSKYPNELSGGMAQRVAMARAFSYQADILLMDEPFKALDIGLKKRLIDVFLKLWQDDKRTTVYVTHDIDEALMISDRIIVIKEIPVKIALDIRIDKDKNARSIIDKDIINIRQQIYNNLI